MKEIYINADDYNSDSIRTIQGNNNAEEYKIYLQYDNEKIDLTNKTVNLAFLKVGSTDGDIIENLNVTDPVNGEITLKITNKLTRKNGTYSCQLAILGEEDFLEHTATFTLTVENNIFKDITKAIADSKDFTYLERILEEAKTVSGDLKTNIPVATNLNSSLESNISNARNINTTLADTTEKSKVAATDAIEKKSQLEKSITKAKEFIDGLDGSQNIPGIRMELTELQNGLKSNQALEYSGSSISANDTLEGRTEGMRIKGKTLLNIHSKSNYSFATSIPQENYTLSEGQNFCEVTIKKYPSSSYYYINAGTINFDLLKPNQKYTLLAKATDGLYPSVMTGGYEFPLTSGGTSFKNGVATMTTNNLVNGSKGQILYINLNGGATYKQELRDVMIFEGDLSIIPCSYFEGIKSFGEAEQEGDKYKISILSSGKNLWDGTFTIGSLDTITGVESNAGENRKRSNFISIEKLNTDKITITQYDAIDPIYVHVYDENKNIIGNVYTGNLNFYPINAKLSVTLPSNAKFLRFRTENNRDLKPTSIQIEEGTQSTSYQEYISNKKDILIKSPLREWDSMYEDNGQVKVDRYTSVIDFSNLIINVSEVSERPNAQSTNWFQTNFIPQLKNAKKNTLNFNNKYVGVDAGTAWKDTNDFECLSVAVQEGGVRIQGRVKKGTTIEQLNEKLRGLIIYYQLATPTVDIVENCVDIDLDTFGEKTYFNILNSLPGTLDFKVPSNIGSVVQNMAKEVNNIWDVINNLLVPSIVKANGNLAMIKLNNNLK